MTPPARKPLPQASSPRVAVVLASLIAAVVLAACGPAPSADTAREQAVHRVVETYNARLAEGFREQDMNALNKVATKDQATTEFYQMAALGEGGVVLLATPRSLRFVSTTFSSETSATVETEETWDYQQVSEETSRVARTERGVQYRLRYRLVHEQDRWLVDSVKDLASSSASRTPAP